MNGKKMSLVFVSAVFLLTGFFAVTSAIAAPGGHGGFGDPVFGLVQKLDLTEAQQKIIADYLNSSGYPAALRTDLINLSAARAKLITDTLTTTGSASIDADAAAMANAEEALIQLRATTVNAILSELTLTTLQQSVISALLSKIGTNSTARIDARIDRLNEWISRHK